MRVKVNDKSNLVNSKVAEIGLDFRHTDMEVQRDSFGGFPIHVQCIHLHI